MAFRKQYCFRRPEPDLVFRPPPPLPALSAHRGAADVCPENTLPALEMAIGNGFRIVEIDVRSSQDGVLYDFHDESLERTTDGSGLISRASSDYLESLDAGLWFSTAFAGVKIPQVESILQTHGRRIRYYFDVKRGVDLESLLGLVEKYNLAAYSFFWFSDECEALKLKEISSDYALKINGSDLLEAEFRLERFRPDIIECSLPKYSESLYRFCREHGLLLMLNVHSSETEYLHSPGKWPADILNVDRTEPFFRSLQN